MARYFFNTFDDTATIDTVGTEITEIDKVRPMAIKAATEALADLSQWWPGRQWRMQVLDEFGNVILTLSFSTSDGAC
jgi:hypothetical protein